MYVMQSLPPKQQGLASGIMNTLVRLASTLSMGIATAVYSSVELSARGQAEPMLKFTRTFQVSIALAGFGLLFVPFLRIGTQGHHEEKPRHQRDEDHEDEASGEEAARVVVNEKKGAAARGEKVMEEA